MKKYDCHKTQDCIHEFRRLCCSQPPIQCDNCPFSEMKGCGYRMFENEEAIAILQKWSDEHPETPKLTKEEYVFLKGFGRTNGMSITRVWGKDLCVKLRSKQLIGGCIDMPVDSKMFSFIEEFKEWTFDELLNLEVEE